MQSEIGDYLAQESVNVENDNRVSGQRELPPYMELDDDPSRQFLDLPDVSIFEHKRSQSVVSTNPFSTVKKSKRMNLNLMER